MKEVVDTDKRERQRFTFEGEVLKRMDHSALPRVYRTFDDDTQGRAYMLMDYIEGSNLEILRQQYPDKRLKLEQALSVMAPVFQAVTYLHQLRPPIIHRDIKPANIIVPPASTDSVLVDLGIAKEYDQDSTTTAVRRCSPGYGAPEQYARGTNPQTDIYGLGATLYALLTGVVPTDALYRMTQQSSGRSDPLQPAHRVFPDIPEYVSLAIQKAMALNSIDRFANVESFWQALNTDAHVINTAPVTPAPLSPETLPTPQVVHKQVAPVTPMPPTPGTSTTVQRKPSKRRWLVFALVALLVSSVALASGVWFGQGNFPFPQSNATSVPTATSPSQATAAPTATAQPTATAKATATAQATATRVPTASATARPTATPRPKPTARPPRLPVLVPQYDGTIVNQSDGGTRDGMFMYNVRQNGKNITGYLDLAGNLIGDGDFAGTVDERNTISFLVAAARPDLLPLLFTGKIQRDGSMQGEYCSWRNDACDRNGWGYGTWNVNPTRLGS